MRLRVRANPEEPPALSSANEFKEHLRDLAEGLVISPERVAAPITRPVVSRERKPRKPPENQFDVVFPKSFESDEDDRFRRGVSRFFGYYLIDERGFSPATLHAYKMAVGWFMSWFVGKRTDVSGNYDHSRFSPYEMRIADVDDFKAFLSAQGVSTHYRNCILLGLRALFAFMFMREYVDVNPFGSVELAREERGRVIPPATEDQVRAAIENAPELDEKMVLILGFYAGLRRAEIGSVRKSDISPVEHGGRTMLFVHVFGKGKKHRRALVYSQWAIDRIMTYCEGLGSDDLLAPFSVDWTGRIVKLCSGDAFTTHQMRYGYATDLRLMGVPVDTIAELLGHTNIQTTRGYAHLDDSTKVKDVFDGLVRKETT